MSAIMQLLSRIWQWLLSLFTSSAPVAPPVVVPPVVVPPVEVPPVPPVVVPPVDLPPVVVPPIVVPPVDVPPLPPIEVPPIVLPPITLVKPSDILDFSCWKLDYAAKGAHSVTEVPSGDLAKGKTAPPYFTVLGNEVIFQVTAHSATTPGSHYSRSELREMVPGKPDTPASWSAGSGRHVLSLSGSVHQMAKSGNGIVIGQIHNSSSDQIEILIQPDGTVTVRVNGSANGQKTLPAPIGKPYTYQLSADHGVTSLLFNDEVLLSGTTAVKGSGSYFKAGNYLNMTSGTSIVGISKLSVSHS